MQLLLKRLFIILLITGITGTRLVQGSALNIANTPLYLGSNVAPNVYLQMDDSGSMDWSVMTIPHWEVCAYDNDAYGANYNPGSSSFYRRADCGRLITNGWWMGYATYGTDDWDEFDYMYDNGDNAYKWSSNMCRRNTYGTALSDCNSNTKNSDWRVYSSSLNVLYFNPELTYDPWVGTGLTDASFTSARSNPVSGTTGYSYTRDLTGFRWTTWVDDKGYSGSRPKRGNQINMTIGANEDVDWWDSHFEYTVEAGGIRKKEISYAYNGTQTDIIKTEVDHGLLPAGDVAAIKQNIANWYQYYRRRSFVAKSALGAVIDKVPSYRYAFSGLTTSNFKAVPSASTTNFTSHNLTLLNKIYKYHIQPRGTPLRRALRQIGRYYDNTDGRTDPIIHSCQQHFGVQMTDGHYNGYSPNIGNRDDDNYSNTLADVAKYYYDKDLSPLANEVPSSPFDPNQQQHMVTFTVAFGVRGILEDTDADGWPNPELIESSNWGNPSGSYAKPEKIDDSWHAAYNGRGAFLAAQTPEDLADSLQAALEEISDRVGSSASVAANTGSLTEGSTIFQARFNSTNWHGELLALSMDAATATIESIPKWDAGDKLPRQVDRQIISYNPSSKKGIKFTWVNDINNPTPTELSSTQISNLLKFYPASQTTRNKKRYLEQLVKYLRGARNNEGPSTTYKFRKRPNSKLGDIINSDPQYVKKPVAGYDDDLETAKYSTFVSTNANRDAMIYVGANDGMLHGFDAETGVERIAYIPSAVYKNLANLAQTNYAHRYFVDSSPVVIDAYINGGWKTVLVGTLAGGGQGVYALDITDPDDFSDTNADSISLWEFTDKDDKDLGFTFSRATIVKLNTGDWGAVFGNGYNNTESDSNTSATGNAVLYIVNLENGKLIKKIDTELGTSSTPNGLATVSVVDDFADPDGIGDYVYAGDLLGNLWKFDISASNANRWDVAFKQGNNKKPLFSTKNSQPITTRPEVGLHPDGWDGYIVYFGTGKYLETDDDDPSGQMTQTFYGILDDGDNDLGAFSDVQSELLEQSITGEVTQSYDTDGDGVDDKDVLVRKSTSYEISWNAPNEPGHKGWYIDLEVTGFGNRGEKQVHDSILRFGKIYFNTTIPSPNVCEYGGTSMLMALSSRNGGSSSSFDLNDDGIFDSSDESGAEPVSGVGSDVLTSGGNILSGTNTSGGGGGDGDGDGDSQETSVGCGRARTAYLLQSGSDGSISSEEVDKGAGYCGRQSWRILE